MSILIRSYAIVLFITIKSIPHFSTLFPYTTLFRSIQAAGHIVGKNFSVQANLMLNDRVWPAMAQAFENTKGDRSEERTSELQSPCNLVCRLLLEKKKTKRTKVCHKEKQEE